MVYFFSINVTFYSQKDKDFQKIEVSNDIRPQDNATMEFKNYVSLSSGLLHLPNIEYECNRNISKDSSIVLNEDDNSYFTMVCIYTHQVLIILWRNVQPRPLKSASIFYS